MVKELKVTCSGCGEEVDSTEYNGASDECNECHDNSGLGYDECGCERCVDRLVSAADFYDND
jgi:hypothetical protein